MEARSKKDGDVDVVVTGKVCCRVRGWDPRAGAVMKKRSVVRLVVESCCNDEEEIDGNLRWIREEERVRVRVKLRGSRLFYHEQI